MTDIKKSAVKYARVGVKNNTFITRFIKEGEQVPDGRPLVIFMAGSPGAGKTEIATRIQVKQGGVHLDPDEVRASFPGYRGDRAMEFQMAVSIVMDQLYSYCLKNRYSVIIDGTLQNYKQASQNIDKALETGCKVEVYYVRTEPIRAWHYCKERSRVDGRIVSPEGFVHSASHAITSVCQLSVDYLNSDVTFYVADQTVLTHNDGMKIFSGVIDIADLGGYTPEILKKIISF